MSTSIPECRRLLAVTTELGGTNPESLSNLLGLIDAVKSAPPVPNPVGDLVTAAAAGKANTAAEIGKLVATAAKAEAEAEYFKRLQVSIARDVANRFTAELRGGAADDIIDSLRPRFDEIAAQIAAATAVVDVSLSTDRLIGEGTPEMLAAYQQLPPLVAVIDRIAALVADFGPHGNFAQFDLPSGGLHNELVGLHDESLFITSAEPWAASQLRHARMADWRTSPALRLPLTLHSVADAKERYRQVCESAWAAVELSRGERGRLTDNGYVPDPKRPNPYARPDVAVSAESSVVTEDDADVVDFEKITAG